MRNELEHLESQVEQEAKLLAQLPCAPLPARRLAHLQARVIAEAKQGPRTAFHFRIGPRLGVVGAVAACLVLMLTAVRPVALTHARYTTAPDDLDMWVSALEQSREQLTADLSGYSLIVNDSYLDDWTEFELYFGDEESL
ncbi:MAG: hypothetical protein AB7N71_04370 [Phycisphaerae bacterium]